MKLYIYISNGKGQGTMIRVDELSGFKDVLSSDQVRIHFSAQLALSRLNQPFDNKTFEINIDEEKFSELERQVRQKISSRSKPRFNSFNLLIDMRHIPIVRILKEKSLTLNK